MGSEMCIRDSIIKDRIKLYQDIGITTLKVDVPGDSISEKVEVLGKLMDLVSAVGG